MRVERLLATALLVLAAASTAAFAQTVGVPTTDVNTLGMNGAGYILRGGQWIGSMVAFYTAWRVWSEGHNLLHAAGPFMGGVAFFFGLPYYFGVSPL
jgi:hypothetical protein